MKLKRARTLVRTAPVIAALLVGAVVPADAAPKPASERGPQRVAATAADSLEVMTWNIHHGRGVDGRVDLERIASVIEQSGAEVVALQEVDRVFRSRSNWVDQAAWLAERLDMHMAWGGNLGRGDTGYGNATLSVHPIVSSTNTHLPKLGGEQRGLLEVVVDTGTERIRVFNTHLSGATALEQSAIVSAVGVGATDTVLMGDFNNTEWGIGTVLSVVDNAFHHSGRWKGATYPAHDPVSAIDLTLHSFDLEMVDRQVLDTLASDHRPTLVSLG